MNRLFFFNLSRTQRQWLRRCLSSKSLLFVSFLGLILLCISYFSDSPSTLSSGSLPFPTPGGILCSSSSILSSGERFMWYAPHSGFSNQLSEFKNALLIAGILNRTLIVPPILDHHAVALGSCPKLRVLSPSEIRFAVWKHAVELLSDGRYVSMADIIDISSLTSYSTVRTIDFRVFASVWCGLDIDIACSDKFSAQSSLFDKLKQCGAFLSGFNGNADNCLYAVSEDCRSAVWIYRKDNENGKLDSFQADEQLRKKKKITFLRRRLDVYKTLGPGTKADSAAVLAFGSLFTSPYKGSQLHIDIDEAPSDQRIQSLIEKIQFLPFAPEIVRAGKDFASRRINSPFLCAQLRLLDGQFKNHWKSTFSILKQKIESLRQKGPVSSPIHIFVMTDLPESNWTGNYLGDLAKDMNSFKIHFLTLEHDLVKETAKEITRVGHGLRIGIVPSGFGRIDEMSKLCYPRKSPDILLYIEEVICSCASLGFVGTSGSTIAESIELMRKHDSCSLGSIG